MTDQSSPKGVNLLKELLFERETRRLEDLTRRIETEAETATLRHKALGERLDAVFERAGTEQRLQHSVAGIIDGALREAEIARHEPLSRAIAPLVVHTIKVQLRDSRDEMVEALYPITGRLVKSYVKAEINRLMVDINAKLGGGRPVQLARDAAARGLSPAELALAEANTLAVEELFLVRRGSGDLIAHWEKPESVSEGAGQGRPGGRNRDVLVSGYLSGIMTFSEEAFGAEAGSFRTLALEDGDRIFVRGSAAHLLAVRCRGSSAPAVEHVIDEVFLDVLERHQAILDAESKRQRTAPGNAPGNGPGSAPDAHGQPAADIARLLPEVGATIERLVETRRTAMLADAVEMRQQAVGSAAPSFTRLYMAAAALALPLVAWGLWSAYQGFETTRTESAARRILASNEDIRGLPPKLDVDWGGRALTISGFVPDATLRDEILRRLAEEVPQARIRDQLGVLPTGAGGAEQAIAEFRRQWESAALLQPIQRVQQRLAQLRTALQRPIAILEVADRSALGDIVRDLDEAARDADLAHDAAADRSRPRQTVAELLSVARDRMRSAEHRMNALLGVADGDAPVAQAPTALGPLADDLAMTAERLIATQSAMAQALRIRDLPQQLGQIRSALTSSGDTLAALAAKVDRLKPPTAREDLENFVRTTAVFFDNGTDLRDARLAGSVLDELARRLRDVPDVSVRVVGYTDERGTQLVNSTLAQSRADRIAAMLTDRGIAPARIVAIGRLTAKDIARTAGPGSANRRVEFESVFAGEATGVP